MAAVDPTSVSPAVRAVAARLRVDGATAGVLRAFDAAGVESVLLKGASNAEWLDNEGERTRWYADCDLLVRPQDVNGAANVLTSLGFVSQAHLSDMPAWWRKPAVLWQRAVDGAMIDLHRNLLGIGADDERVWTLMSAGATTIMVGGYSALAPAIPARAFHLAAHAAQHGPEWAMGLGDLERALVRADDSTWRAAAELAEALDATALFVAGLRLIPAGQALIERLELAAVPSVEVALLGGKAPSAAFKLEQIARTRGLRARFSIIRHKLFPTAAFLRHWSPLARRGRLGLAVARAWRPLWVLRRLPPALRAWLASRRTVQGHACAETQSRSPLCREGQTSAKHRSDT